jgi:hypothetical protein
VDSNRGTAAAKKTRPRLNIPNGTPTPANFLTFFSDVPNPDIVDARSQSLLILRMSPPARCQALEVPMSERPGDVDAIATYLLIDRERHALAPPSRFVAEHPAQARKVWGREATGPPVVIYEVDPEDEGGAGFPALGT